MAEILLRKYIDTIIKDRKLYLDIVDSISEGNILDSYKNVAELGKENSDNGCREENDTDESFGSFLIQAYKDGYSKTVYAEMPDGVILTIPKVS